MTIQYAIRYCDQTVKATLQEAIQADATGAGEVIHDPPEPPHGPVVGHKPTWPHQSGRPWGWGIYVQDGITARVWV